MYSKKQRTAAKIGIAALLLLYIINFFIGIFCNANTFTLFLASLLATFFIPTLIFVYLKLMDYVNRKNSNKDNTNNN